MGGVATEMNGINYVSPPKLASNVPLLSGLLLVCGSFMACWSCPCIHRRYRKCFKPQAVGLILYAPCLSGSFQTRPAEVIVKCVGKDQQRSQMRATTEPCLPWFYEQDERLAQCMSGHFKTAQVLYDQDKHGHSGDTGRDSLAR